MVEDDWSLKDNISCGTGDAFDSYYTEETIDILRQKLIEDIEEYFSEFGWEQNFSNEMISIINKRFGYES